MPPFRRASRAGRQATRPGSRRDCRAVPRRPAGTTTSGRLDAVLGIAGRLAASHDREELFRTIVDETQPGAPRSTPRRSGSCDDGRLEVAAWAGMADDVARRLPVFGQDEGWAGEVLRTGRVDRLARHPRRSAAAGSSATTGVVRLRRPAGRPAHPPRPGHRRPVGRDPRAARLDRAATSRSSARSRRHAAIALTNAELFEQTETRAAQLEVAPGRIGPDEPGEHGRPRSAGPSSRRRAGSSTTTTPGSTCIEPPDDVVPIAFEGTVGAYEQVDFALLRTPARRGLHRLGRPARRAAPRQRRQRRPARRDDPGHRRGRRVDARRADALRRRRRSA